MTALLLAVAAGLGVHLLWTAWAFGSRSLRRGHHAATVPSPPSGERFRRWLRQAGLDDVEPAQFVSATAVVGVFGAAVSWAIFASPVPALIGGVFAASAPIALHRSGRRRRTQRAQEAWPHIIEEIRILTGSVGRSIPQALFEAGRRAPVELRGAFDAAQREWLLTTDFNRTTTVLKDRLADPTADAACETLLIAHEVGGSDLDRRLEALAEDRIQDLHGRRDARAAQAGVRFARLFVLIVPVGMAMAGMTVGSGRVAYRSPLGQAMVAVGMLLVIACWWWAGRYLRLPEEDRVFDR